MLKKQEQKRKEEQEKNATTMQIIYNSARSQSEVINIPFRCIGIANARAI